MTSNDSKNATDKISILPKEDTFQHGRLGVEQSKVTGILKINYPSTKPLVAKKIELVLSGKEEITWTEYQQNTRSYTPSVSQSEQHEFTRKEVLLWESEWRDDDSKGKDSNYEVINNLELPFTFMLDNNLPSSAAVKYDDGSGRIYYRVIAIIHRKSNIFKLQGKKKIRKFIIPIKRYAIPQQVETIRFNSSNEKKGVGYDVEIDRDTFAIGESIIIPIKINLYDSNIKIKKVFAGIKQNVELWNAGSLVKPVEHNHIVSQEAKGSKIKSALSSEQGDYYFEMNLLIPDSDGTKNSVDHNFIVIWHQISIKISLEGADDILLEKKVKVINFSKK